MKIKGIDISEWQPDVDFAKVKKDGIKFVILREGCGTRIDKQFLKHVKGCMDQGINIFGVYHFLYPLSVADARKEAKSCIKNLKTAGLPKDTVVFSDFEYDTVNSARKQGVHLTRTNCIDFTKAFLDEIQKAGYRTGIYANQDYYKNWYSKDLINDHIFWLAHYTTGDPAFPCTVQQYTSTGSVKGIKGNVDMNWYFQCASIVDVARGWIGGNKKEVIDTYNSHKPLPRGYKVKYIDPYCATFVSACAIKANVLDFPIECSCPEMIKKFQSMGKWMESDDYKPSSGDIIFYDWDDSGIGDNKGTSDHVGIVEACDGVYIYVIEGNMGSDGIIGKRQIRVNAKYIRGFGLPNYTTKITVEKKSVDDIAKEVINGQWGNGSYRISALKTAGYDPDAVQKKVNDLLGAKTKTVEEVAQEVLDGKWGNGTTRKKKLTDAGYDYDKIQSAVNDLIKKKTDL